MLFKLNWKLKDMEIKKIFKNKSDYMDILLIGDEQENMINKYLEEGSLYALYDNGDLKSVCIMLKIDNKTIEIKNIATYPAFQNKGYASSLIKYICEKYKNEADVIILGTGENDRILSFYKKRGFHETHRIKDFFINNYDHPIFENGSQLIDMIYLSKKL